MGAFLGRGDIGVWASNRERDAFLDWFAEHRCSRGDARWEYCKHEDQRWMGRCIELEELLLPNEILGLTDNEYNEAAVEFGHDVAKLLRLIDAISRKEWNVRLDSVEAKSWREPPIMNGLTRYGLVRILRLLRRSENYDGWKVNQRPPNVGDVGTIVEILHGGNLPPRYVIESCDSEGRTIWLADFDADEIESISDP